MLSYIFCANLNTKSLFPKLTQLRLNFQKHLRKERSTNKKQQQNNFQKHLRKERSTNKKQQQQKQQRQYHHQQQPSITP